MSAAHFIKPQLRLYVRLYVRLPSINCLFAENHCFRLMLMLLHLPAQTSLH